MTERMCMTVDEVAAELGISRPTAYELTHRADFPVVRLGRRVIVPRDGLQRWLEQQSRKDGML